jgi:hypothetical protein
MREQFCTQDVAGDWLDLPHGIIRTKTNPMNEELGDHEKDTSS